MGDNLVLRFQYRGKDTDVVVNDVDKVNDLPKPTAVVQAAQSLKAMGKTLQSNEPNTEQLNPAAHVEKQLNPAVHVQKQLKPVAVVEKQPKLVAVVEKQPTLDALVEKQPTPLRRSPRNWPEVILEIPQPTPEQNTEKVGEEGRGGLEELEGAGVGGEEYLVLSSHLQTVAVDLAQDLEESNGLNLDSDQGYNPQLEETDVQVDSEDVSLDDEDDGMEELEHQSMPLIHDYFDPYEGPAWEDDCEDIDNYMAKLYRNGEVYKPVDFGHIILKPWQLFTDKMHLRDVVRDYCIQSGFSIVVEKASNWVYTVRCSDERCSWRLHGSKLADGVTWAIKSLTGSEHTCLGLQTTNPMVSAKWAKKVLLEDIRADENIPAKSLNRKLFERFGVQMTKSSLYRMKAQALIEIHGGFDVSYSYLPNYCEVIKSTNPGSLAHCTWNSAEHPERPLSFNCIFISFKGCLDGVVAGCRGLIGVNGTFLKGNYGGVLLSAIALDGNNEMFPLAWAVVSCEDERNWKFFIHHLNTLLQNTERGDNWCIISDRHKAGAASATSPFTFGKAMKQIQKNKDAA
ncbi:1-deoxy-D-xylulose-5-phosphate synthase [Bienertia sinuspersici]